MKSLVAMPTDEIFKIVDGNSKEEGKVRIKDNQNRLEHNYLL